MDMNFKLVIATSNYRTDYRVQQRNKNPPMINEYYKRRYSMLKSSHHTHKKQTYLYVHIDLVCSLQVHPHHWLHVYVGPKPKLNRRHFVTKNEFRNTRREKVVIIISEEY
jgi:hypothetical protein